MEFNHHSHGMEEGATSRLETCCLATIEKHAANNPMMVCQDCKLLIKCFTDPVAWKNYIRFCTSRGRRIVISQHLGYQVVAYFGFSSFQR